MSDPEPLACTLGAGEMSERQAELRSILGGSLLEAEREGHALRLELRDAPGLDERLARIVRLERECCPFLTLAVERQGAHLVVKIDGPREAAPVIDGFHELAVDARPG